MKLCWVLKINTRYRSCSTSAKYSASSTEKPKLWFSPTMMWKDCPGYLFRSSFCRWRVTSATVPIVVGTFWLVRKAILIRRSQSLPNVILLETRSTARAGLTGIDDAMVEGFLCFCLDETDLRDRLWLSDFPITCAMVKPTISTAMWINIWATTSAMWGCIRKQLCSGWMQLT